MKTIYLPIDEDLLVAGYYWTNSVIGKPCIVQLYKPQWRENGWVLTDGNEYTEHYSWDGNFNYKLVGPIPCPLQLDKQVRSC